MKTKNGGSYIRRRFGRQRKNSGSQSTLKKTKYRQASKTTEESSSTLSPQKIYTIEDCGDKKLQPRTSCVYRLWQPLFPQLITPTWSSLVSTCIPTCTSAATPNTIQQLKQSSTKSELQQQPPITYPTAEIPSKCSSANPTARISSPHSSAK